MKYRGGVLDDRYLSSLSGDNRERRRAGGRDRARGDGPAGPRETLGVELRHGARLDIGAGVAHYLGTVDGAALGGEGGGGRVPIAEGRNEDEVIRNRLRLRRALATDDDRPRPTIDERAPARTAERLLALRTRAKRI